MCIQILPFAWRYDDLGCKKSQHLAHMLLSGQVCVQFLINLRWLLFSISFFFHVQQLYFLVLFCILPYSCKI